MEYTAQQKQGFIQEFAARKKRQMMVTIPVVVAIIASFGLADQKDAELFGLSPFLWTPVLLAAIVGLVVFSLKNWRCPACTKYLGKGANPQFCPKCGVQLAG